MLGRLQGCVPRMTLAFSAGVGLCVRSFSAFEASLWADTEVCPVYRAMVDVEGHFVTGPEIGNSGFLKQSPLIPAPSRQAWCGSQSTLTGEASGGVSTI